MPLKTELLPSHYHRPISFLDLCASNTHNIKVSHPITTMASQSHPQNISDSPVRVKSVHSSHSYQSDRLEEARLAVLQDLGSCIPELSYEIFLKHLAPQLHKIIDLRATMQSLKLGSEPILTSSDQWSKFSKAPKDSQGSEDTIYSLIPEIFNKVVDVIVANSDGKLKSTVDFLQNPTRAPTSAERYNESRPDGYLVLKDRTTKRTKDGKNEDILWADVALSCEYKRKDGVDELDDVRIHHGL